MAESAVDIRTFCLGPWQTNCFVVRTGDRSCWFVDAGFSPEPMIRHVQSNGLEPRAVLLTHAHVDHIAGLAALREAWPQLPILIHEDEQRFLTEPALNLSLVLDERFVAPPATGTLQQGQDVELDGAAFEVRHTPGHSPGGITLYHEPCGVAIVGDTLFAASIGRTDFPTSNHEQLMASIRDQLLTLPDDTRVLPGHGPETTIGRERAQNPFVR